jgi:hypothetical protein
VSAGVGAGATGGVGPTGGASAGGTDAGGDGGRDHDGGEAGVGGGSSCSGGAPCSCVKVTPDGDDAAAALSNAESPFATVQAAIDFAFAHPEIASDVCVAAGPGCGDDASYPGPSSADLRMRDGVNVRGAYESTTWGRCMSAKTTLLPSTGKGVLFGPDVLGATVLDGFWIALAAAPATAGVTIDGAPDARLNDLVITDEQGPNAAVHTYGVDVKNGGGADVTRTTIRLLNARGAADGTSVGIHAAGGRVDAEGCDVFGVVGFGRAIGVELADSPGSSFIDGTVTLGGESGCDVDFSVHGIVVTGDLAGLQLSGLSVSAKSGSPSAGISIGGTGAGSLSDNDVLVSGCGTPLDGIVSAGGAALDLDDNQVLVDNLTRTGDGGTTTGITCDDACTIRGNDIDVRHTGVAFGDIGTSRGIRCPGCSEVSRNRVDVLGWVSSFRAAFYRGVGIDVGAASALVDSNQVQVGCADDAIGVVATNARIQNNFITGRLCEAIDSPQSSVGLVAGSGSDVHSNTISSGTCAADNMGVSLVAAGATFRNNLLEGCSPYLSDLAGGRAPAIIENNDLGNADLANALPYGSGNFTAVCSYQSPWPCIDTGTPTGAPSDDFNGDPRGSLPDVGALEWVDPCDGQACDGRGTCMPGGCVCNAGYVQDPFDRMSCAVDECSANNGGCDPLTSCTNRSEGRLCGSCPPGYMGDGDSGCDDIDECQSGNGGCDPLVSCTNEPGRRTCGSCPTGYLGDGVSGCYPDECATDNGGCDPLVTCTNHPSGPTCGPCPDGYAGDGESGCLLVSACQTNPCQNGGTCQDQGGTEVCLCPTGINGSHCEVPFVSLHAGDSWVCGLGTDQKARCWGSQYGAVNPPSVPLTSMVAGWGHACGLKLDGTIACWGNDYQGPASPPSGTFSSLAAFERATCGVRTDDSVVCWGNTDGIGDWDGTWPGSYRSVSLGNGFGCGVLLDGTLGCVGEGVLGAVYPPSGTFEYVRSTSFHSCALATDRTVGCWGTPGYSEAVSPSGTFMEVETAKQASCGLRDDGSLECWGYYANLGTPPAGPFLDLTMAENFRCALEADHTVACWGSAGHLGLLGTPPTGQP